MAAPLPADFVKALTTLCRVENGQGIVAAVSGGPDSMALLHLLAGAREPLGLQISAVWIDHGFRPRETPHERATVSRAAEKLGLPFVTHNVDTAALAATEHLSLEQAARRIRYQALRQTAKARGAQAIAVGHTADDQAEEVLLRLLRGSGRKAVSGMRHRNGDIIRPLLEIDKQTLLAWLEEQGIEYCLDSSNSDLRHTRNRIRHQLLPFLEEHFDPRIRRSLRKSAASLAEDEDLLEVLTSAAYQEVISMAGTVGQEAARIERRLFCDLHPAIQRRVVEQLLWQLGSRASYNHILLVIQAAARGRTHTELHLSRGLRLGVFRDHLSLSYPAGSRPWRGRLFA